MIKKRIKVEEQNLALGPPSGWPLVRNVGVNPHPCMVPFPHSLLREKPSFGRYPKTYDHINPWIDTASSRHVRILNWGYYSFFMFFLVRGIIAKAIHTSDTSSEYCQLLDSMLPVDKANPPRKAEIDSTSTCNPNIPLREGGATGPVGFAR